MNTKVEKLENSMVKLTIEVDEDQFDKGIQKAYLKERGQITLQGFRKGKAPRKLIEKSYGEGIFYEEAANQIIPGAYDEAVKETAIEVMSRPNIDVTQIGKGKAFIFTAEVAVKPEVVLGDYKELEVEVDSAEVTEEEIQVELEASQKKNARLINIDDRSIEMNDKVIIDFDGYVNDEQFEGGKAEDFELVIGSGSFIDTFEEQLIGKNIGDVVTVNVTFPEDYQSEALKGMPARFEVSIKAIKMDELPILDDEFAKDISEFDTLDEYKEDLTKTLLETKEEKIEEDRKQKLVVKVIENATMAVAQPMIDLEAENMSYEFVQRIQSQGMNVDDYFKFTGQTMETLKVQMAAQAVDKIKGRLVLEAIGKEENIEITDDEYAKELDRMASLYNMEVDKLKETIKTEEEEAIKQDMVNQKAIELLVETAK